jgi:hypothetical protein
VVNLDPGDELLRRLHFDAVKDDIVTSAAHKTRNEYDQEISVHIAKLLNDPRQILATRPWFGIGAITVADARSLGFEVRHDPLPGDDAHALLIGANSRQKARQLAALTRVLIPPRSKPGSERSEPVRGETSP